MIEYFIALLIAPVFGVPTLTGSFVVGMGVIALFALRYELKVRANTRQLSRHNERLAQTSTLTRVQLDELQRGLEADGLHALAHRVREYAEGTHTHPRPEPGAEPRLYNAHQARELFAAEDVRELLGPERAWRGLFSAQLVDAAPGLLTSLGILGTFIGLVIGLHLAQQGATPEAPLDIEGLIGGLSTSFWTSVMGLFASVVVTVCGRAIDANAATELDQLVTALDARVERRTSQQILEELLVEQRKATAAAQEMSTDLAEALREAMGQAVQTFLAPTFDRLAQQTEEMKEATLALAQGSAERQVEGLGQLVDGFVGQMSGAVGGALEQASAELQRFATLQAETTQAWAESIGALERTVGGLDATTQRQERAGAGFSTALERGEQVAERFESGASLLAEAAPSLATLGSSTRDAVATAAATLETARASQDEALATTRTEATALFTELGQTTSSIAQTWSSEAARLEATIRGLVDAMSGAATALDTGTARLQHTVEQSGAAVSEAAALTQAQAQLQQSLGGHARTAQQQTEALRTLLDEVARATHSVDARGAQLREAVQKVIAVSDRQALTADTTLKATQQIARDLDHRLNDWTQTTTELRQLHGVIARSLADFAGSFPEQLSRNLEAFDRELETAITKLTKQYGFLQQSTESLTDTFERVAQRYGPRA